jgi:hypothetical protein
VKSSGSADEVNTGEYEDGILPLLCFLFPPMIDGLFLYYYYIIFFFIIHYRKKNVPESVRPSCPFVSVRRVCINVLLTISRSFSSRLLLRCMIL